MERIDFYGYLIELARATALRATCPKRNVGAVIADSRRVIVGTGYNGPPRKLPHCSADNDCGGVELSAPESHNVCIAAHAEINAIISSAGRHVGGTLASTLSPCRECVKAIINAGIRTVVYAEEWRLFEVGTFSPGGMLRTAGVKVIKYYHPDKYRITPRRMNELKPDWVTTNGNEAEEKSMRKELKRQKELLTPPKLWKDMTKAERRDKWIADMQPKTQIESD